MTGWKRRWARLKQKDKVLSLIGLAMKAGRCTSGEMMTESETKSGRARLVIIASDASLSLGNAITSLMLSAPAIHMATLSMP